MDRFPLQTLSSVVSCEIVEDFLENYLNDVFKRNGYMTLIKVVCVRETFGFVFFVSRNRQIRLFPKNEFSMFFDPGSRWEMANDPLTLFLTEKHFDSSYPYSKTSNDASFRVTTLRCLMDDYLHRNTWKIPCCQSKTGKLWEFLAEN